jgi:hypothetical protein
MKQVASRWATALSLSNLCFVAAWSHILYPPFKGYHFKDTPGWANFTSPMIDVLLLAGVFVAAFRFIRNWRQGRFAKVAHWSFVLITFAALNSARIEALGPLKAADVATHIGKAGTVLILAVALILSAWAVIRRPAAVIKLARVLVLIVAPFVLVTFAESTLRLVEINFARASAANRKPVTVNEGVRPTARVLWLVFDELDYRATFELRPASIHLPELDRLRGESLFATKAYPPAGSTTLSLPALITGKLVSAARPSGPDELMVTFDGSSESMKWSTQPNIFTQTLAIGGGTGVVGWHHPYCRVIGQDLTQCSWSLTSHEADRYQPGLGRSMVDDAWRSGLTVPLLRSLLPKFSAQEKSYQAGYVEFLEQSLQQTHAMAADPNLSLVLIHFPTPHPPCAYSRVTNGFSTGGCDYFDNLALVDRTLGELRRALQEKGMWDQATVLVSSDHWWRLGFWKSERFWTSEEADVTGGRIDYRVPFILKLKNERQPITYEHGFNTVVTHDLLLAVLRGELSSADDVTGWLDRHRTIEKSPY